MDFKNHAGVFEIKASQKSGIAAVISGYFAVFNNLDTDGDIITPGAFTKTIEERGPGGTNQILHLLQHDTWQVLAKPTELREDTKGLFFTSPIVDTALGVDTVKLYKAGVYTEHSIGYKTLGYRDEEDQNTMMTTRYLTELKLWEGSTVSWGANAMAQVTDVKSAVEKTKTLDLIIERMDRLQKALTDNKFTKKTVNTLEIELGVLTQAIKTLQEPAEPTTSVDSDAFLKSYDLGFNLPKYFKLS